ncbi:hypothetical protein [Streptomyces sp. NWU339]|uniref:hypothetical protein n=1 Tax=Streptomyces sp. NWU339 TaxID=2185284 RepID=UPI0015E82918|nr:hypothetical protein [Streptomyces sp. NWU339]
MTSGLTKEREAGAFEGVMPWLRTTYDITTLVRGKLDRVGLGYSSLLVKEPGLRT